MIPADLAGFVQLAMETYVRSNPDDEHGRNALGFDKLRFVKSLEWLAELDLCGKRILEVGGYGIASHVVRQCFPDNEYVNTDFDLRSKFPYANDRFDVLISMEVLEHICDVTYLQATTLSGVRLCLQESLRVLKPEGKMFLTTPNASAVWIIQRVLLQQPPWLYEGHFHEFTIAEVRALVEDSGFRIVRSVAETVWHLWNFDPILDFMKTNAYSLDDRGDDTFLIAEKPAAVTRECSEPDGSTIDM